MANGDSTAADQERRSWYDYGMDRYGKLHPGGIADTLDDPSYDDPRGDAAAAAKDSDSEDTTPAPTPATGGGTPTTPPTFPGGEQTQQLLRRVMQQRSSLPIGPPMQPQQTPYMTGAARTHDEGGQMFMYNLGAMLGNAAAAYKAKQVNKNIATIFQPLHDAWEKAQDLAAQTGQDPKEIMSQMPYVQEILSDPKNQKVLGKVFSYDAMNPSKNDSTGHAAMVQVMKTGMAKKAMDAMKGLFTSHMQRTQGGAAPTPGSGMVGPGGIQGMTGEPARPAFPTGDALSKVLARATPGQPDIKGATEILKSMAEVSKAQLQFADQYTNPVVSSTGAAYMYDKKDPTKRVLLRDDKGDPIRMTGKLVPGEGKPVFVENVPYGIVHMGEDGRPKIIKPGDPEWTGDDDKTFRAASAAGAAGEANKRKLMEQRATFFSTMPQGVLLKQDDPKTGMKAGELAFVTRGEAAGHPEMYAPPGPADRAMQTKARFGEIQRTMDGMNAAIEDMPETGGGFDSETRAALAYVLRSPDPNSALDAYLKSEAAGKLTAPQVEYVQWLTSLQESAMNLAALSGQRGGSDRVRGAISAMLPGAATPSRSYARGQMQKVQTEIDALEKGVPGIGAAGGPSGGGGGGGADRMTKFRAVMKGMSAADARKNIQASTSMTADEKKTLLKELPPEK